MKKDFYTIIANWKMYLSFDQALTLARSTKSVFELACEKSGNVLVLCPSFESIFAVKNDLSNSIIRVGAQDCAAYAYGAHTGQVQAASLAQMGCTYCIVGHSERRFGQHEKNEEIAQKITMLIASNIIPVLCIGESEYLQASKTCEILAEQLEPIQREIFKTKIPFYIVYEPVWSIGTGIIPKKDYLEKIFCFIKKMIKNFPNALSVRLLYGGSVNAQSCLELKEISTIQGFLVGKASIDFQELKKIVLSL